MHDKARVLSHKVVILGVCGGKRRGASAKEAVKQKNSRNSFRSKCVTH
jgi:hypothetical protein